MTQIDIPVVIEPKTTATAAIIWLHGLGADGHDFADIVPQLGLPEASGIRFIFPHAPIKPVTINSGYRMRAWYDIYGSDINGREDDEGIRSSEQLIHSLIDQQISQGIEASRIILAGFSQGGAIALYTGLRYPQPLAGIIALSTYLPLVSSLPSEANPANREIPIFMAHGIDDNVIPIKIAFASRDILQAMSYPLEWHSYPMPHSVCYEEIQELAAWLGQRFS